MTRKVSDCPNSSPRQLPYGALSQVRAIWHNVVGQTVTYVDLIGKIVGCGRECQHAKYNLSSHPKSLELMASVG